MMTPLRCFADGELVDAPAAAELLFATWRDGNPVAR